jgi:hypothetical protein
VFTGARVFNIAGEAAVRKHGSVSESFLRKHAKKGDNMMASGVLVGFSRLKILNILIFTNKIF